MCAVCGDKAHDDLDDDLIDIFGDGLSADVDASASFAAAALARPVAEPEPKFWDTCKSCKGSGHFRSYTGRLVGKCFKCAGKGQVPFKTSPEARAKAAEQKAAKKQVEIDAWIVAHQEEFAWLTAAAARGNSFATAMQTDLAKYGSLSANKVAGIQKGIVRDQLREQEKKDIEAMAPVLVGAPLEKIEQAFRSALEAQIKYPKLRLDTFVFSPAKSGKNAGSIYVKHASEVDRNGDKRYLGRITDGRFVRSHGCTPDEEKRIIEAAMDPQAAAKAYGRREGRCSMCGRPLTNGESIDMAMGPICAGRFGW